MKVVNADYTINGLRFKIALTIYRIIGTETGFKGMENAKDEIINTENGKVKVLSRKQLKKMCNDYKAEIL